MQTIRYELADGIATLTFDEPGASVNTMCAQWQQDLGDDERVAGIAVREKWAAPHDDIGDRRVIVDEVVAQPKAR